MIKSAASTASPTDSDLQDCLAGQQLSMRIGCASSQLDQAFHIPSRKVALAADFCSFFNFAVPDWVLGPVQMRWECRDIG